ncbi:hypothetical protein NGM10_15870 (plasmid) [Halorussus salilacus]|uniref:hypothetical protein n=1 Tax=Halorussus salilacus TaxID=2953750 RepID=UPI0020A1081A|nr:hypothetical protein [Halorussus salilacus]USZ69881.1 hypothetical protein NGM10_15870 [Halorussus salilacus]
MVATPLAAPAADPSAAVVGFLGSVLVAFAAGIFGFYAVLNLRLNRLESQGPFWRYLALVGATASLYGVLGVAETLVRSRVLTAFGHGALLVCIVFLSLSMREVYYNSALAPAEEEGTLSLSTLRRIESAFVAVIAVEWLVVLLIDQLLVAQLVKAGGSVAFAAYGVVFGEKLESMTRGTTLDTLRRHLLPVLVCLGALGVVDLGTFVGVAPAVVDGVRSVFVVLVAAFFVTATIRLQQNVEGLSAPA